MDKQHLRVLLAVICFAGLSVTANAETRGQTVVVMPFEFMVSGQTLPAGTYTVSRFSDDRSEGVILSSREKHVSVFVHPVAVASARVDQPSVSFESVGASHFLSEIETASDVFTLPVSRAVALEAGRKQPNGGSDSGSYGGH